MAQKSAEPLTSIEQIPPGEHGKGFPPFAPEHFASQLLWLVLIFGLLYWLMARVGLPRVGSILEARRQRIEGDVAEANRLKDDADTAMEIAEGIINVVGRDKKMPNIRVGLASGPVVQRLGDVFGPPVNMAARLTAVARRNRIIVDQKTADGLDPDTYESRRLTARPVRGFGLVEPLTVRRR